MVRRDPRPARYQGRWRETFSGPIHPEHAADCGRWSCGVVQRRVPVRGERRQRRIEGLAGLGHTPSVPDARGDDRQPGDRMAAIARPLRDARHQGSDTVIDVPNDIPDMDDHPLWAAIQHRFDGVLVDMSLDDGDGRPPALPSRCTDHLMASDGQGRISTRGCLSRKELDRQTTVEGIGRSRPDRHRERSSSTQLEPADRRLRATRSSRDIALALSTALSSPP